MTNDSVIIQNPKEWGSFFSNLQFSKLVLVADANTEKYCLPHVLETYLNESVQTYVLPAGEGNKNLDEASKLWSWLLTNHIDRNAVIVAVGGGMVTDLAGFVASTYKRGIRSIYFPTTNLAMCDAAIGGKTGVNYHGIKNQIGTFHLPEAIVLDANFLNSLPYPQLASGLFETVKHAMIGDAELWNMIQSQDFDIKGQLPLVQSMKVKQNIVNQDFKESGIRQALNFGHTVGHAMEAYAAEIKQNLYHGEAIAFGMLAEAWISNKLVGLSAKNLHQLEVLILKHLSLNKDCFAEAESYLELMRQDKKNKNGAIVCSLVEDIGKPIIGKPIEESLLVESIQFAKKQLVE